MIGKEVCELFNVSSYKLHKWLDFYNKDFDFSNNEFTYEIIDFLKNNPFPSRSELLLSTYIKTFGSYENYKKHMIDTQKETFIEKYGDDYKQIVFHKKSLEGKIKKHGSLENAMLYMGEQIKKGRQNMTFEEKQLHYNHIKESCLKKYGVENVFRRNDVIEKANKSRKEYHNSDRFKNKINEYKVLINEFNNRTDIYSWERLRKELYPHSDDMIRICLDNLGIKKYKSVGNERLLYITEEEFKILKVYVCGHKEFGTSSLGEREISNFIKSICDYEILENDRKVIKPKELDIYVPLKNVAIEFNGLRYHSEQFCSDKNYHLNKTISCENKNIRLIHIFEDEWNTKKEICKSIISSSLDIYKRKISSEECIFKEISIDEYKNFTNENHIQGYSPAKYKYGLYYDNELVQCVGMSNSKFHENEFVLIRMCTKLNTQIVGGFTKLMKNANKNCISFIDRRLFDKNEYIKSGFTIDFFSKPNYNYVVQNKRMNRIHFQKYLENLRSSNNESFKLKIDNIFKIWDCGTIKVKYLIK